ncbi:OLC1v1031658C1 [Oldenlandia corymbosa var. corymbosa]|uniref:OLC1v1031658C1 n=1 Tax=Oldenlandia corymbosa var. corymbosa TaxID=529605 RepID=A0AAV1CKT4_OLDCO|nr:OLC1v1031658C1 [Oldenlandia corymbosa var. corymbosa]
MEEKKDSHHILEINLVSAQDHLKKKANEGSKAQQTYAVVWVDDSSRKLRTRIDCFGGENPTWNDKFLFRVSSEFINSATAGFNVEIYNVGRRHLTKDSLVETARCLLDRISSKFVVSCLGNLITTVHVHRPSGRFQGFLNVGALLCDKENAGADLVILLKESSVVNFHELSQPKSQVKVEEEGSTKSSSSLLKKLRLVISTPSLSTMSEPLTRSEVTATMRTVKSDSSLSTMILSFGHEGPVKLKSSASLSTLFRDNQG